MFHLENESVVAQLLRTHAGEIELIDAREFVPNFVCRAGLSKWPVLDDADIKSSKDSKKLKSDDCSSALLEMEVDNQDHKTCDKKELIEEDETLTPIQQCLEKGMSLYNTPMDIPEHRQAKVRATVFPPTPEESSWMNLEKCMRCLPQDEDTGGFFVATIRKIPLPPPSIKQSEEDNATQSHKPESEGNSEVEVVAVGKGANKSRYTKKVIELKPWDEDSFVNVRDFYGLEGVFADAFFIREDYSANGGAGNAPGSNSKSIYYLPPAMRSVLLGDVAGRLKVVSGGVKVLERRSKSSFAGGGDCGYRILQEGIEVMAQWVTARKVAVSIQDFCNFLEGGLVSLRTLSFDSNVSFSKMKPGSCICTYTYSPDDVVEGSNCVEGVGPLSFSLVVWRGSGTAVNVMAGKVDADNIKHKLETLGVWRPKISNKDMEGKGTDESKE